MRIRNIRARISRRCCSPPCIRRCICSTRCGRKVLNSADINPAEAAWINEQMELAEAQGKQLYDETPTDEVYDEKHEK